MTLLRAAHLGALLLLLVVLLFAATMAPPSLSARLTRIARASLWTAIGLALAWAATIAWRNRLPSATDVPFLWVMALRLILLLVAMPFLSRRRTGRAVAVILIAGAIGLQPVLSQTAAPQPLWPFPWRPSLDALAEPDDRRQLALALIIAGVGVAVASLGGLWRRSRIISAGLGGALVLLAVSMFGPLAVQAYPTSFYRSPTRFAAASIDRGRTLFASHCAACHGPQARGDGPAAAQLPLRPADLTAPHLWGHTDGELFWWVSTGLFAPDGTQAMPGFATTLSADDRWNVIDFVRANNAGLGLRYAGAWPAPIPAPALPVDCDGVAARDMAALRGNVVRIIAAGDDEAGRHPPAIPPQAGYRVITLQLTRAIQRPLPGECVTASPAAWDAYAVLSGLPSGKLTDSEFLVDPDGWLRAAWRPGTGGWSNPDQLIAEVRRICTHPIAEETGGEHDHHD